MMYQNGPTPFIHPVTQVRIAPFAFYEGAAHLEQENIVEEPPKGKKKQQKEEE
jgi:hypothetical protein